MLFFDREGYLFMTKVCGLGAARGVSMICTFCVIAKAKDTIKKLLLAGHPCLSES